MKPACTVERCACVPGKELGIALSGGGARPRRFVVSPSTDFLDKAARVVDILRGELPVCCRRHVVPALVDRAAAREPPEGWR